MSVSITSNCSRKKPALHIGHERAVEVDPSLAKVSHSLKRKHPEFRTSRLQLENETPTLETEIEELETRKRIPQNFAAVLSRCLVNFENISVLFYMSVRFCLGLHFTSAFLIL